MQRIGLSLAMLLALSLPSHAAVQRDALVLGERSDLRHFTITLAAGNYRLGVADLGAGSSVDMASAQALLVSGDRLLASADLTRTTQNMTLTESTEADLFVTGKTSGQHGDLGVWVERSGGERLLEETLYFGDDTSAPARTYSYSQSFRFTSPEPVKLELTDLGALLGETAFDQFRVTVIKNATTKVLSADLTTRGDHAFSQTFVPDTSASYWIAVVAVAPDAGTSMLGWALTQTVNGATNELESQIFQVDDNTDLDSTVLGEFDLSTPASVAANVALLSPDVDDFSIALASVSDVGSNLLVLNKSSLAQEQILDAGHYRVLLLAPAATRGLLGVQVRSGNNRLLDTSVSLGDYRLLGEFAQATAAMVDAGLHVFLQKPAELDVRVASSQSLAVNLNLANARQTDVALSAGQYRVWAKSGTATGDSYYRVHLQPQSGSARQWWGALGDGLISSAGVSISAATTGTLSTRNFNLPDALSQELVVLLARGDSLIAQYNIDPADATRTFSGLALPAGELQLAIFGKQSAGKATVVGYTLETTPPADPSTPDRGANGSGGGGGGGSMSSFILYCLLVVKILRGRITLPTLTSTVSWWRKRTCPTGMQTTPCPSGAPRWFA